jgi:hypothetical protein
LEDIGQLPDISCLLEFKFEENGVLRAFSSSLRSLGPQAEKLMPVEVLRNEGLE